MTPHVRWARGGEAEITSAEDDRVRVRSTISSAPGSRLDGAMQDGAAVRLKVHRCVRVEGGFEIEGRLLDARRELRDALTALAKGTASSG